MNNRESTLAIAAVSMVLAVTLYFFVPQEMMPLVPWLSWHGRH